MQKDIINRDISSDASDEQHTASDNTESQINRRKFVEIVGTGALAFTIVPRHVLGGKNYIAPSDKITLAYVGCGTQGLREMLPMLAVPGFQVVAVCDPNKNAIGYKDWSKDELRNEIREAIKKPDWESGGDHLVPGGRDNAQNIVDSYYSAVRPKTTAYKSCTAYADYRELLDKEKDLDAVKIMTPDHLHGSFAMAAIKRNKHVLLHKPISNRLLEGKKVIEMARKSSSITHLIPWDSNGSMVQVMAWINGGDIGTLKEVHNWTNRPVWPQYPTLPPASPIPDGLDWNLWLGPEADRPYSPEYTNMVFRGWYDFGGGSMADMGHYSLWSVFNALELAAPTIIEPNLSHFVAMRDPVPFEVENDFSFPMACSVRFKYPAAGSRPPIDLIWYDGGIRPQVPLELQDANKALPEEGMMFVGDKGKILCGFHIDNPQLLNNKGTAAEAPRTGSYSEGERMKQALQLFVDACKSGKQYPGNFREAEPITEAVNLYAASLRSRRLLKYDGVNKKITNVSAANKYLTREYRTGWDPMTM